MADAQSVFMDGDPDMIHQVVYNLIENAVKFTNENGYIELKTEDLPGRTCFTIRNSGAGIPADEISMIFDRFYKTDKSRSKDKTGMGLGLYIVRTIIRLHGGEITVSSVENEYCQFSFWIPNIPLRIPHPVNPARKIRIRKIRPIPEKKAPRAPKEKIPEKERKNPERKPLVGGNPRLLVRPPGKKRKALPCCLSREKRKIPGIRFPGIPIRSIFTAWKDAGSIFIWYKNRRLTYRS